LDLPGGNTANGNKLQIWDCNGLNNQKWVFAPGSWKIVYAGDTSKCIDVPGGDLSNGNPLQIWDCNGKSSQIWGYDPKMDTIYLARSAAETDASKCLDLAGGNAGNGGKVELWDCNGQPNQQWTFAAPTPSPSPSGGVEYCPQKNDLIVDYGPASLNSNGWSIKGGARVSSKAACNILGGYIEFDIDLSAAHSGINQNVYVSSLNMQNCGSACYCDAPNGGCMELDFLEANGHCAYATTWHTTMVGGQNCDVGGCQHIGKANNINHVKAAFSNDGWMAVFVNGEKVDAGTVNPHPSSKDAAALKARMQSHGVVIESSQWGPGWVPQPSCGGDGNKDASSFKVYNLRVKGAVINGPEPSKCTGVQETMAVIV